MSLRLAIAGATGIVGRRMLRIIESAGALPERLGLLASPGSAGTQIEVGGQPYVVESLAEADFSEYDAAFFCVGDELSQRYVPQALAAGCAVVDKSGVYRLDPQVPLVVPGVNDSVVSSATQLIANPNCSTIILLHALAPLAREFGLRSAFAATYQSVSGAGRDGVDALDSQSRRALDSGPLEQERLESGQFAFNVLPQIGRLDEQGRCSEEAKLVEESRKILALPGLQMIAHAARVPVAIGHGVAVTASFETEPDLRRVAELWNSSPVLRYLPDGLPTPVSCAGHDLVECGRLRRESALPNALSFFVCGDNVNIGAALNGWRILGLLKAAGALGRTAVSA